LLTFWRESSKRYRRIGNMADLIFLTGPTRSGKSRRAVEMAQDWGDGVVFVATYRSDASDDEMVERVRRHRAERRASWRTLEAPADIAQALADLRPAPSGAVIDSIVLWLADRLDQDDSSLVAAWERQLDGFRAAPHPVIVVGDEIGWGPVPMDRGLRRFRDLAGLLGQRTAARASEAWLMVAGCGVRLK
jgi:adenosylcobinamide kinase / adenosylcobinamide-phosphate guanylyltransferase